MKNTVNLNGKEMRIEEALIRLENKMSLSTLCKITDMVIENKITHIKEKDEATVKDFLSLGFDEIVLKQNESYYKIKAGERVSLETANLCVSEAKVVKERNKISCFLEIVKTVEKRFANEVEKLGLIYDSKNFILETYSPEGENFYVKGSDFYDLIKGIKSMIDTYDVDEQVSYLIPYLGKRGIPTSIRALLEGAEAMQELLEKLGNVLKELNL